MSDEKTPPPLPVIGENPDFSQPGVIDAIIADPHLYVRHRKALFRYAEAQRTTTPAENPEPVDLTGMDLRTYKERRKEFFAADAKRRR